MQLGNKVKSLFVRGNGGLCHYVDDHCLRLLIVLPDGRIHKLKYGPLEISFREAPLTATTLAALVPEELGFHIQMVDESVGTKVPFDQHFDLVAISAMTGTSTRAYEIADIFRRRKTPVVLGGVHVTLMPEEAARHADTIVLGFAEQTWPQLLRDFAAGRMEKVYKADSVNIDNMPMPRRDLQKKLGYMIPHTVLMTRGCKGTCEFCSVPAANMGWATRPIGDIINELRSVKAKRIAISDVHLTEDVEYAKELFKAMAPLKKSWGALASTRIAEDEELLDLMRDAGCDYLLLGIESINNDSLSNIEKRWNRAEFYKDLVHKLHSRNIVIQGCFIFGFDEDDKSVFSNTVDFINELKVDIPRFACFTPYPKTRLYTRLKEENRILHEQWYYYDTQHVVIIPNRMSPEELDEGFKWAYKETFTLRNNLARTLYTGRNFPITFIGNLAYKIYIKRLYSDADRFPAGLVIPGAANIDTSLTRTRMGDVAHHAQAQ